VLVDYREKMETTLLEMREMMFDLDLELETVKGFGRLAKIKATSSKTISSSSPASEKKAKGILKTSQSTKKGSRVDSGIRKDLHPFPRPEARSSWGWMI